MPTPSKFGLYDILDDCWLGHEDGPNVYTNERIARAAATIATEQLGRRIKALSIPEPPYKLRDEVPVKLSPEEAIKKIEGRA